MAPDIRNFVTYDEEVLIEGIEKAQAPWRMFAVGAKSYLTFANTRGGANAPIAIPLMDKNDAGRRSHNLTIQFSVCDEPRSDEIVIALAGATGGRPHHRNGDRYQDLKDLGHDIDNPASV